MNRRFKDREDNPKEVTDWYRICAFNGVGAACANHLQKGDAIFVEGRLQVRTFESRNGQQTSVEIVPTFVRFVGSPPSGRIRMTTSRRHRGTPVRAPMRAEANPKAQTGWIPMMICPSNGRRLLIPKWRPPQMTCIYDFCSSPDVKWRYPAKKFLAYVTDSLAGES